MSSEFSRAEAAERVRFAVSISASKVAKRRSLFLQESSTSSSPRQFERTESSEMGKKRVGALEKVEADLSNLQYKIRRDPK